MIVQVSAERYYNGQNNQVDYLGNYQPDGYVYFNDNQFYRCRPSGTIQQGQTVNGTDVQICYMSKNQWVRCGMMLNIRLSLFTTGVPGGSAQAVMTLARSELGNTGAKYWDWYRTNVDSSIGPFVNNTVTAWCAAFISYLLGTCGISSIYFPALSAFDYRDIPVSSRIPAAQLIAGDIISFNWNGGNTGDHVGLCIGNDGTRLHTIEGNINNGHVTETYRDYSKVLFGIRPSYVI